MARTLILDGDEVVATVAPGERSWPAQKAYLEEHYPTTFDDPVRSVPEWKVTENYSDRDTVYWSNAEYDATIFIEDADDGYHVGIFDRSLYSVAIPAASSEESSFECAVGAALSLSQHLDEYVGAFRDSDAYRDAKRLEREAPPWFPGNRAGLLPDYLVRQRMVQVYGGDLSVEEALAELRELAEERGTHRHEVESD